MKKTWRSDLRTGFKEAFRVPWPHGVLIFKWGKTQIPVSQILAPIDVKSTIGQHTGKNDKTHWIIFVKDEPMRANNHPAKDLVPLDRLHQIREHPQYDTQYSDGGNRAYTLVGMLKAVDGMLAGRNAGPVTDVTAWHGESEERACDMRWRHFDVSPEPFYAVPPKLTSDDL